MTPYQFFRYVDGYNKSIEYQHDSNVWLMYNNAALSQMGKKMPPLKKFLFKNIKPKEATEEDVKSFFKTYQAVREAKKCQ